MPGSSKEIRNTQQDKKAREMGMGAPKRGMTIRGGLGSVFSNAAHVEVRHHEESGSGSVDLRHGALAPSASPKKSALELPISEPD